MANLVFNIALGKVKYYAELPGTSDALLIVALETTGLEADATLRDYDDLAALLAGSSNEQTTIGARKVISAGLTLNVDDTANTFTLDIPAQTYTAPTGNAISAFLVCYDPDTGTGTDSSVIPLLKHDVTWTPDGNNATLDWTTVAFTAS